MIILIGKSASGKTEIAKDLNKRYGISKIVTYTTRNKRVGEIDKIDYNFVSKDEFIRLKDEDFFVETTCYNDNFYGTAKKDIKDDKCVILDPNGLLAFDMLNDKRIVSFYLDCNEKIREERMKKRLDDQQLIKSRLEHDRTAFKGKLSSIKFTIDSSYKSIEELTDLVYKTYMEYLENI